MLSPVDISQFDWECETADTQYLTHSIHRYSGKFIPQIARNAIELLTSPGDIVLDPYCGSGTTLLECMLARRKSIGIDLNPLAIAIATCKTRPISREPLRLLEHELRRKLADLPAVPSADDLFSSFSAFADEIQSDPRWSHDWYRKWFKDAARWQLIAIDHAIRVVECPSLRLVALLALSDILRKCSNAHRTYPNVMFDKNSKEPRPPISAFFKRLQEISAAIADLYDLNLTEQPNVIRADAACMPLESRSVDAIVTHPPYIGSIPYAEYGLLSITWLGHDAKELDATLTGGRRQSRDVVDRFVEGFRGMLGESYRVLRPGGRMFMLLGTPLVKGKRVNLPEMALSMAADVGFSEISTKTRNGVNRRANLMGHEMLLFFERPR